MLSDVLKEFDDKFVDDGYGYLNDVWDVDLIKQFITEQISKAIDEVIPDKIVHLAINTGNTYNEGKKDGHNKCVDEILENKDKFLNG